VSRPPRIVGLHHVQLAMPAGAEDEARRFYGGLLGLTEIEKPPELAMRGGVWFALGEQELHLGVEEEFRPARKAHPAIRVVGIAGWQGALVAAGCPVVADALLPGYRRVYVADPFGNRLELIEPASRPAVVTSAARPAAPPRPHDA
jgi:catechol 2,3-dioxygenase-like lactoylglutathione lyase family enzyme